jgi:hypothetical protein
MKPMLNPHFGSSGAVRGLLMTVSFTALSIHSMFAQGYDETNIVPLDDFFDVPTPSVDEYVDVGGFQLKVDRAKWGIDLRRNSHGLLGRFEGHDVEINVVATPTSQSWNPILGKTALMRRFSGHVERLFTSHAVPGIKAVYNDKSSRFGGEIAGICYFFVNSEGQTICFEVRAKSAHPDWSEATHLVQNTLSLSKNPRG